MTDNPPRNLHLVREPELEAQAAALRSELASLQLALAQVKRDLAAAPGAVLREAQERLALEIAKSQGVHAHAQNAKRRQMQFLVSVAHELRTPLVPLRLASMRLAQARSDDSVFAQVQATIKDQVAQMSRLVGDLLDGTRLGAGKFRLERTLVDVRTILLLAMDTCKPAMEERQQQFTWILPDDSVVALGDAARLVQVFCNLLQNSSKYTPPGGRIWLRAEVGDGLLSVTVADNGIGISPKVLPDVFDMFARDAHAAMMSPGGLGIGLAVVQELIKAHEGSVAVRSEGEGRGCEFVVSLPVQIAPPQPA